MKIISGTSNNIDCLPFTKTQLIDALEKKLITVKKHPKEKLYIFNYTPLTQYSKQWNDVTKTCRGLILDDDYRIVARPFQKIFNYSELELDPVVLNYRPIIQDKLDGSLGIAYLTKREGWRIATRGSFTSDQAKWANEWFDRHHPTYEQPDSITCLFEIVYPENRICVDYGERSELILIAAINNATGADFPLPAVTWWKGSVAEPINELTNFHDAASHALSEDYEGKEGIVCTWVNFNEPAFRIKIKHPEYVRLHGIIHSFSKKRVWESLAKNENFLDLLSDVPDEFYELVKETISELKKEYADIEKYAKEDYEEIKHLNSRKAFAIKAKESKYSSILFKMMEDKDYSSIIWKMIKPKGDA